MRKKSQPTATEAKFARTRPAKGTALSADQCLHDLQVHQIELEMQSEALRQTQQALEESRDRYVDLYEFAPVGYLTLDETGLITEANLTGAGLLGGDRAKLLQRRLSSFVLPEDQNKWHKDFLRALKCFEQQVCEVRLERKDGNIFHARLDLLAISAGEVRVTLNDITDRKQLEASLLDRKNFLRTILESEPECVKVVSSDGSLLEMNPAGLAMLEVASLEEAQKKGLVGFILPEDQCAFLALAAKVLAGESGVLVFRITGARGTQRWLESHASPLRNENGEIGAIVAVTRDITERKVVELRLEELMAEQKAMLENELVGIVKVKDRIILWCNPAFENLLGYGPGELAGTLTRQNYLSDEAHLAFGAAAYPVLNSGQIYRSQIEQVRKDGVRIWIDASGVMLDSDKGISLWGFVDISKRVELELNLQQKNVDLEQFAYAASHDLRQPLRMISSYLGIIEKKLGPQLNEDLKT